LARLASHGAPAELPVIIERRPHEARSRGSLGLRRRFRSMKAASWAEVVQHLQAGALPLWTVAPSSPRVALPPSPP
jgi:hypothetical protein